MGILLAALGVGILSYLGFVFLFPKAMPEDTSDYTQVALDRIYEENRVGENESATVMRDILREEPVLIRLMFSSAVMRPIYEAALQAGYQRNLSFLVLLMAAVFGLVLFVLIMLGLGWFSLVAAAVVAYYAPYRHCMKRVRARNRKFLDLFPDALDMIVRSVRSGFPLSVALQMLAENMENPVKEEFRQVVDEIALGRTLPQALNRLAARINQPDIRFFVVVLSVQQETGGNLAEIIGNLSNIIRKRKQLRHKIRAMTSEGRATAWVLGLLPVLVFLALLIMQPEYLEAFWTDRLGMMLFGTAVGLIGICVVVVNQMINVDV
jgi:tight adherence protein B